MIPINSLFRLAYFQDFALGEGTVDVPTNQGTSTFNKFNSSLLPVYSDTSTAIFHATGATVDDCLLKLHDDIINIPDVTLTTLADDKVIAISDTTDTLEISPNSTQSYINKYLYTKISNTVVDVGKLSGVSVNRVYSETAAPGVTGCTNGEWTKLLINSGANASDLTSTVLTEDELVWDEDELKVINNSTRSIQCTISFEASILVTNDTGDLDPYVNAGKVGLLDETGAELCSSWRSVKGNVAGQDITTVSSTASASTVHTIPPSGTLQLQGYLFTGDADRNITVYDYSIVIMESGLGVEGATGPEGPQGEPGEGGIENITDADDVDFLKASSNDGNVLYYNYLTDKFEAQALTTDALLTVDSTESPEGVNSTDVRTSLQALSANIDSLNDGISSAIVGIIGDPLPQTVPTSLTKATFTEDIPSTNTDIIEVDSVNNLIIVKELGNYKFVTTLFIDNDSRNNDRALKFVSRDKDTQVELYSRFVIVSGGGDNSTTFIEFPIETVGTFEIMIQGFDDNLTTPSDDLTIVNWYSSFSKLGSAGNSAADQVAIDVYYQATVSKGTPLKIVSGGNSDRPFVQQAVVGDHACFAADDDYSGGSNGTALIIGCVKGLDTSGSVIGDPVYVAPSGFATPWTLVKPSPESQQYATIANVGGNDGSIGINIDGVQVAPVVGDGGLTEKNFTTTLYDKLNGIEANANNYILPSDVVVDADLTNFLKAVGETRDITTTGGGTFGGDLDLNSNNLIDVDTINPDGEVTNFGGGIILNGSTFRIGETISTSSVNNTLGSNAGDYVETKIHTHTGATNSYKIKEWLKRQSSGSDWATTIVRNGISIDTSYDTPATSRCWWERDPSTGAQYWGDSSTLGMSLGAAGDLTVTGDISQKGVTLDNTYIKAVGETRDIITTGGGGFGGDVKLEKQSPIVQIHNIGNTDSGRSTIEFREGLAVPNYGIDQYYEASDNKMYWDKIIDLLPTTIMSLDRDTGNLSVSNDISQKGVTLDNTYLKAVGETRDITTTGALTVGGDVTIPSTKNLNIDGNGSNIYIRGSLENTNNSTQTCRVGVGATLDQIDLYAKDVHINTSGGNLRLSNIPTSSSGLGSGDVWSDGGTLKIV